MATRENTESVAKDFEVGGYVKEFCYKHSTRKERERIVADLMRQALDAMVYHTEQTRPIEKTKNAIYSLRKFLNEEAG